LFYSDKVKNIDGQNVAGEPLTTLWDDILSNNLHKEGGVEFPKGKKPEALIKRCLDLCTAPNDIVLDSFGGSGTTGAVAQKMKRRWIMVELGDHADTHIAPRLRNVIDGKDPNGVSDSLGWIGGGGFRFFRLAPSLLAKDKWGNWVISKDYNAAMLGEAMCKLMGFTYAPSQDVSEYWRHGYSSERDFIYVTTASLTHDQLKSISLDVGPERTLLICCKAFNARPEDFENLTVKKIPHAVLSRCEWGRDDYSLEIASLPTVEHSADPDEGVATNNRAKTKRKTNGGQPTLFGGGEE
jgi:adenine-specific DNA-methyltransferase